MNVTNEVPSARRRDVGEKTLNDMSRYLVGFTALGFRLVATCSDAFYLIGNGAAGQLFSSKVALPSNATVALYPPAMSATARNATLFLNLTLVNSDLTPRNPSHSYFPYQQGQNTQTVIS